MCQVHAQPQHVSGASEHTPPPPPDHLYLQLHLRVPDQSRGPDGGERGREHTGSSSIMGNFFGRQRSAYVRVSLPAVCFVWQIAMIILFGVFIRYNKESDAHWVEHKKTENITSDIENDFYYRYPSKCDLQGQSGGWVGGRLRV